MEPKHADPPAVSYSFTAVIIARPDRASRLLSEDPTALISPPESPFKRITVVGDPCALQATALLTILLEIYGTI